MAVLHFMVQAKGGAGKTSCCVLLAQYLAQKELPVSCFCTDNMNRSFSQYKAFNVESVSLLNEDKNIDPQCFDPFFEKLLNLPEGTHAVIDNGASSSIPLCGYIRENDALDVLREAGHAVFFHTVINGGTGLVDTLNTLDWLGKNFYPIVAWCNPFHGPVRTAKEGRSFEEMPVYEQYRQKIHSVIHLPELTSLTKNDVLNCHSRHLSFAEADALEELTTFPRQRLRIYWRNVCRAIDMANLL